MILNITVIHLILSTLIHSLSGRQSIRLQTVLIFLQIHKHIRGRPPPLIDLLLGFLLGAGGLLLGGGLLFRRRLLLRGRLLFGGALLFAAALLLCGRLFLRRGLLGAAL